MQNRRLWRAICVFATLALFLSGAGVALAEESIVALGEEGIPITEIEENNNVSKDVTAVELLQPEEMPIAEQAESPVIRYQVHGQSYGWQAAVENGAMAGSVGSSKRLEAMMIHVDGVDARVEYSVHVQRYGWQPWKSDGELAGTVGNSLRLEAMKIRLVGPGADLYSVEYRTHVQSLGWQPWVCDGAMAGTSGRALRLEALEIRLVRKPSVRMAYTSHVQSDGWQLETYDGSVAGTQGRSLRMEAFTARVVCGGGVNGGIAYRAHVQGLGWMPEVQDGALCGTEGQARRLEAFGMRLTGSMSADYDVWYRGHVQRVGWTAWACNGEEAGSTGLSLRVEAMQVMILPKGASVPVSTDAGTDVACLRSTSVVYTTYVHGLGWQPDAANGAKSGTTGRALQLEAMNARLSVTEMGRLQYRVHMQGTGWTSWQESGTPAGYADEGRRMEAVEIRLTGAASKVYDVWYRVHAQKFGWMGWACNGESAGTSNIGYRTEAVQIMLVPKGGGAPGSTLNAFTNVVRHQHLVLIGDSRTVGMYDALYGQDNYDINITDASGTTWSARVGAGYSWMVSSGVPRVDNKIGGDSAVVILLGVNDILDFSTVYRYISYVNAKADQWVSRGASVYMAAISPVGLHTGVDSVTDPWGVTSNSGNVAAWNATVRDGISANVHYLDTYNAIASNYRTGDGVHYDNATSRRLYNFIKTNAI